MLPVYTMSIDGENAEEEEGLGVFEIANTDSPAIKMKGIAFSSHEPAKVFFKDDLKYRIAAPVLTPDDIYRRDDDTGEESYYRSTTKFIEQVFMKFMRTRAGKQVFNEEHDEAKKVPAYPLETWLVEDPKTDKSKTVYGIECPKGTWFMVQQFTDKEVYHDYVKRGLTGFSIHGNANLVMSQQKQDNMLKFKEKKRKVVANLSSEDGSVADIILAADKFEVGSKVVALDSDMNEVENFTGKLESNLGLITLSEGTIESIEAEFDEEEKTDTEMEAEKETEVEAAEETTDKETTDEGTASEEAEKTDETEVEAQTEGEFYTKEEIDAKIKEVTDFIAEAISSLKEGAREEAEDAAEEVIDPVQMKMRKVEALKNPALKFATAN